LAQWRAYCPPEGGYEVIFERKTLEEHLIRHGFQLKPCIYDVNAQRQITSEVITPIISGIGELEDDRAVDNAVEKALDHLAAGLSTAAPVLKHPDFITVGPNSHQLLAMRGLQALKSNVNIGRSPTPLRNL
jgi:hypothetical protein